MKNTDYVHFSGDNVYLEVKDVDVTYSGSYKTISVELDLDEDAAAGEFYVSVQAFDDDGDKSSLKKLYYEIEIPDTTPSLDISDAEFDMYPALYCPGDTIEITGIRVKNTDYVHFSGDNEYLEVKDVDVTYSGSYKTISVELDLSEYAEAGEFYVSVQAFDDDGDKSSLKKLEYEIEVPDTTPVLDMSNAKIKYKALHPGESVIITGIRVKNCDYVHFSGNNTWLDVTDVDVSYSGRFKTISVELDLDINACAGSFYVSVQAFNDEGESSQLDKSIKYSVSIPN